MQGDPKIGYATMMHIREIISCSFPKIYGQAITIAVRYSLFRKQFQNRHREEITIANYQTQQDKLIPRIAEYYAIIVAGNKIKAISQQNTQNILNKKDVSLLQETHSNLSFSKSLFSEIVFDGI